jgi:hypothetical protein
MRDHPIHTTTRHKHPIHTTTRHKHPIYTTTRHKHPIYTTTRHKSKQKNRTFIAVLHFTVTVGSSTLRITHNQKWVWKDPQPAAEWHSLIPSINTTSRHLCSSSVIWCMKCYSQPAAEWHSLIPSINTTSRHLCSSSVIWCMKCYSQMQGYQQENKIWVK